MENKPDAGAGTSEIFSRSLPPAHSESENVVMAVCNDLENENGIEDIDRTYIAHTSTLEIKDIEIHERNLKLIKLIKGNTCLYDRNHEKFEDLEHRITIWQDIASQMKQKRSAVKKRFASLYQLFGNVYFMLRDPEVVAEGFPKTDFLLYKYLFFLKDHIDVEKAKKRVATIVRNSKNPPEQQPQQQPQQQKRKAVPAIQSTPKVSKMPKMVKSTPLQRLQPYQRYPDIRPPLPMRDNMPGPSQFFQNNNSFPSPLGPPPLLNPQNAPMPPMDMGFRRNISPPPMHPGNFNGSFQDDRDCSKYPSVRSDDTPDDCHVDYFFKGVSQQVKKSNISDRNFMDLQSTILTALTCKLSKYHK